MQSEYGLCLFDEFPIVGLFIKHCTRRCWAVPPAALTLGCCYLSRPRPIALPPPLPPLSPPPSPLPRPPTPLAPLLPAPSRRTPHLAGSPPLIAALCRSLISLFLSLERSRESGKSRSRSRSQSSVLPGVCNARGFRLGRRLGRW
jgi:hypothetical protein